ncbi:MAG: fibronectin type III domain-containing protein, partial [Kiritimatiellae bacterium]|nr:fibronectin type III domain-containing protein [Kiritimatiellia bacterium]
ALPVGPGYSKNQTTYPGHYLAGVAGQAIESAAFELQGARSATLAFQHTGWNSKLGSGIETSRLNVYYQLDGGEWSFLTSVLAKAPDDNSWTSQSIALPAGALDGETLAVKLVVPNAEHNPSGSSGTIRGAGIKGLSLTLTAAAGKYGESPRYSLSGYPRLATSAEASAKSVKVSWLIAGQSVGFRVQALQGSTANPTAKSVWVEAEGTATAYTAPGTPVLSAVTRNGMTATWTAGDTTDLDHYEVQWSTSSTFATTAGSANVAAGTLTKAIAGLTANTTYYVRVRAVGTDSQTSAWSGTANATTTAWGGPTGLDFTARGRYSLTAGWDAVEGDGVTYSVDLTSCAADPSEVSLDCTEESLSWGSSDSAWTYQRSMSGSTSGSYPQWNSGNKFHLLLGQWGTVSTHPGIESPRLNLSGASSARVTFKHRYYNNGTGTNSLGQYYSALYEKPRSTVTVYYKVGSGSWVSVGTTAAATVYCWSGAGTERSIDLPVAALVANVKVKVVAEAAHAYTTDAGAYKATGPIIEDLAVVTMTSGGVDYGCDTAQHFTGLTASSQVFTGLTMDTPYYVRVKVVSNGVSSVYSEAMGSTLEGPAAPESVWADAVKQTTMRVEWDEPDDATAGTRYKLQVSSCKGTDWTREAVAGSATNRVLAEDDDWSYIGGGTAVEDLESVEQGYFSGSSRKVLPTWTSTAVEASQVLAGSGEPGLQSAVFSTVGATNVSLVFGHGRWYASADADKPSTTVTLSYSTDGGASWTEWATNGPTTKEYWYSAGAIVTNALPADALGKPEVAVRIVAKAAGFQAAASTKACGAAIGDAKVVAQGAEFNESCLVPAACAEGLTELSQALTGLLPDTTYYFRVAASDGTTSPLQYGAWTEGAAKTLAAPAKPDVPWAESVGTHGFTMLWKAVEGAEAYNVKVYTSGNESSPVFARDGVSGTTVQVTGLGPDTTYFMKVQAVGDITTVTSAWSDAGSQTTLDGVHVTGLRVENETLNSLDVVWDNESGLTYKLDWGTADATGETVAETLECPNETLKRSDSGKGWFYIGGSASWPSYYVGSAANDKGHGLIYTTGGAPGLQSRWFSTRGASKVTVTFDHGRFNATANSAVTLSYSLDEGKTWTVAGTSGTSSSTVPTDSVTMELPPAAMNQKTVAVRLTAESADGNKGAHVNNGTVTIWCGQGSTGGSGLSVSGGRYTLSGGSVTAGTRYWFRLTGTEGSESDVKTTSGATHEAPATFWKSQGFDGYDSGIQALSYTTKFLKMSDGTAATGEGLPTVQVVDDENPLYGNKALRFSGSASATVFGVAEFDVGSVSGRDGVLTIPFAAKDLGKNDYLYFSYSINGGTTWLAPAGATEVTTMGGAKMGRIGVGGSDVLNQNWAYNKGTNTTTRPLGDAFQWVFPAEVRSASTLKFRLAFCGQSGGAAHYYYVDNISLLANAGIPAPVSATERDDGGVDLTWTPPTGQDVIIVCGKDQRNPPPSPLDLNALPAGYHVVMNGESTVGPEETASTTDYEVAGGDRYYYYFYAVLNGQIGLTPAATYASPKGMVLAIASQGWDGWDVHPWSYRVGRVTNPGRSSDYGWWKANGMNTVPVAFIEGSYEVSDTYYASGYYGGTGSDKNKQIGATDWTNYYGENCLRMSGSQGFTWNQSGTYIDYSGNEVEFSNPHINTTNAAIEFANVDLSGYKNVRFSMHFAGRNLNGGNDLHVAISTNGGATGTWLEVGNNNDAGWRVYESHQDYGRAISDGDTRLNGNWSFYFEDSARATPYGNPYVLQVPDSVTQIMVRVMFYDSNGGSRRDASYF